MRARESSDAIVTRKLGTTRHDLYNWKYKTLGKEYVPKMRKDRAKYQLMVVIKLRIQLLLLMQAKLVHLPA